MFRFFPEDDPSPPPQDGGGVEVDMASFRRIVVTQSHYNLVANLKKLKNLSEIQVCKAISLSCVNLSVLPQGLEGESTDDKKEKLGNLLKSTSDLVPGVYEGGFKTWECTFDLVKYVEDNFNSIFDKEKLPPGGVWKVLDLGCGSGLVGLAVLKLAEEKGVEVRVDFQDYNEEVIDYVTAPNTLLNFDDERVAKCSYFSGDWDHFVTEQLSNAQPNSYDVIFSSETIYNLESFPKFLRVLKSCLKNGTGCLYLAAKTFYFGVGGNTRTFLKSVELDSDSVLDAAVVHGIKEGVHREILRVFRK
ncbi:Histidine protein methyltransferase 1 [Orchesella cincta]|uniref:protein-histidine N-methyltransferase n=1 Tax=Orchesella cincta TaxID=48709 RepID=A0A1D2MGD7_ORCCI|nr:Histidine protein methyltransferase 1 [Orchesella cincta]